MNSIGFLVLVFFLSGMSLLLLSVLRVLEFSNIAAKQKVIVIRCGLLAMAMVSIAFILQKIMPSHTIEIVALRKLIVPATLSVQQKFVTNSHIQWQLCLTLAYFFGVFITLFWILLSYFDIKRKLSKSIPANIFGQKVFLSDKIDNPLSFGVPLSRIYLPTNARERWTTREIQMIISHEQNHVQQYDALWKILSLIVRSILFIVPWAYTLHRKFEFEMEAVCDEKVLIETKADFREYGSLLLAIVSMQSRNLLCSNLSDSTIKQRFSAMRKDTKRRPLFLVMSILVILSSSAVVFAVTSGVSKKLTTFKLITKLYDNGKLVSSPQLIVIEDQNATIYIADEMTRKNDRINMSGHSIKLELMANNFTSTSNDAIRVNYGIKYQDGDNSLHEKDEVVVMPKQESIIHFPSQSGHDYEFHIIAERK